jgi:hypothetical protein
MIMAIKVTVKRSTGNPAIVASVDNDSEAMALRDVFGMTRHKSGWWYAPGFYPFACWVVNDLKEIGSRVTVVLDKSVSDLETELQDTVNKIAINDIDNYVPKTKPYDHQIEALSMAIHIPRLGLFLDPGLGKTKVACDLILYTRSINPGAKFLVVALRVNLGTWVREMGVHSGGTTNLVAISSTGGKEARSKKITKASQDINCAGIVVTYDTCRVSEDEILAYPYTNIILDESHSLRGATSGRTKSVLKLANKPGGTQRRLLLSGTPSLGSPLHMWGQLKALGDFVVGNYWQFMEKHCVRSPYNKHIILGYKNVGDLNDLVTSVSLRKTAEECLDMPERVIQIVEIEPESKTRSAYNGMIRQMKESKLGELTVVQVGTEKFEHPENTLALLGRLSQVSMGFAYRSLVNKSICDSCPHVTSCVANGINPYTKSCKVQQVHPGNKIADVGSTEIIDSVIELVESHIQSNKKVIVWARHRWVLDTLYTEISKITNKVSNVYRYDSTTADPSAVELQFNSDTVPSVIVAQISMGIGVTFKAPVMVYAEVSWSLDHWLQSMDRNYGLRAAGLGKLLVQAVVLKGSISSRILELLSNKIDVSSLLSKRVECATCVNAGTCLANNILPFDNGCILDGKADKKVTLTIQEI